MTDSEQRQTCDSLFRLWRLRLIEHHAVPLFMIGIGQDHREGQCVTCLPHDVPITVVRNLMKQAIDMLDEAIAKG